MKSWPSNYFSPPKEMRVWLENFSPEWTHVMYRPGVKYGVFPEDFEAGENWKLHFTARSSVEIFRKLF